MSKQTNDFQQLITMIMELLVDGEVVESKMFPDPDTGEDREVDIYALIRGSLPDGRQVSIAVECIDWARKADAPWVEKMYGKHCRLQAADIVLLVSKSGFFTPAEKKAKAFGFHTIHPNISPKTLSKRIGLAGDFQVGFKMMTVEFGEMNFQLAAPAAWDNDEYFRRNDGSELLKQGEFMSAALFESFKDVNGDIAGWWASAGSETEQTVTVDDPHHAGEPLHVRATGADGEAFIVRVKTFTFTARISSTDTAGIEQTERGTFGGLGFGTGKTTFEGEPARMVVAEDSIGGWTAATKWHYEVKPMATGSDTV